MLGALLRAERVAAIVFASVCLLRAPAFSLTNDLALTPPMGWNSWNKFHCNITEGLIRQTIDAMAANGLQSAGYQYINLDDCWQVARDTNGIIVADPVDFPSGIGNLAAYAHATGLKLGVYSDHGTNTCAGRPGSYGYEAIDAATYAAWGVDYLKYDNCNLAPGSDQQADYYAMRDALMNSGRPIVYSICAWTFKDWMPEGGNLWRTTGDITDTWSSMVSKLDANNNSAFSAGPGRWNDPDMLEVGNGGMTDAEYRAHFGMWCMAAAPLLAGNDLRSMSQATRDILTAPEVIAIDQDPAGVQGIRISSIAGAGGNLEVWSRPIENTFCTRTVALFNRSTNAAEISVSWADIGLANGTASVRDLWARSDLGVFTNAFIGTVPGHAIQLLKVTGSPPSTNYVSDQHFRSADNGWGPVERDRSNGETGSADGHTLTLNGVTYSKGIGVHAPCKFDCYLAGAVSRFQSDIGVDDEVGSNGSVTFRVWDGPVLLYDSGIMTGSTGTKNIDLDVTGKDRITLQVTDGGDGKNYDHADWAGARLILAPAPVPVVAYWTNRTTAAAQSWDIALNWTNTPAVPNAEGVAAVINADIAAPQTINLNRTITSGFVSIGDVNVSSPYTVAANGGALTFDNGTSSARLVQLQTSRGDTISAPVTLNGNLTITNSSTNLLTLSGPISGLSSGMTLGQGTILVAGSNTFGGTVVVQQGTLILGHALALGITNSGTLIGPSGTLDVNGFNAGAEPVTASGAGAGGNGAIVNTGPDVYAALAFLRLTGDTSIGGTRRWDLRSPGGTSGNPSTAVLTTEGHPWNLTKLGTNFVSIVSATVDPALADIQIQSGTLNFEGNSTGLGNPTNTITVFSNATLFFYRATNQLDKRILLLDGATVYNNSGTNIIAGPVRLGTNSAGAAGNCTFNIGGSGMDITNSISGSGNLVKTGASSLYLGAENSYSGSTFVNTGTLTLMGAASIGSSSNISIAAGATLDVTTRSDQTLTLGPGQVLSGNGTLRGSLQLTPGATLSPGTGIGMLTVAGSATLQGTTAMDLNSAGGTNDVLEADASLAYGGTLLLTNTTGTLAAGDTFKLFDCVTLSGGFSRIIPAVPGAGLSWDTNTLSADGILRVVSAPRPLISSVFLSQGNLVVGGTNGPQTGYYYLLSATNLAFPSASWQRVGTGEFNSGIFRLTNVLNWSELQRFYRLQLP